MENVLDIYKRPYNPDYPVVCFDEKPCQLIGETRISEPMIPGHPEHIDYEYKRNGTCNVLMAIEPLRGWRMVKVTETKKAKDWAEFIWELAQAYPSAKKIILVEDNFKTHKAASWYETFPPEKAKLLMEKFDLQYTPKHGSWLNAAEIELNVIGSQCLKRRIEDIETMQKETTAWQHRRNLLESKIDWHFTTEDARIKLKRLYPVIK